MIDFSGAGSLLTNDGLESAMAQLQDESESVQVGLAEIWSILSVEASGCGFLTDRRPAILFERHIFSRLTNGTYDADDPDISAPTAGGYGSPGAHQFARLAAAIQLDRPAALQSASWGLGQILGENFKQAGFEDIETMVSTMVSGEDKQLLAMATFIKNKKWDQLLRTHNWSGFAQCYNGPNYAANKYDDKLKNFYQQYSSGTMPDLNIRAAQILLTNKGFSPGGIDGVVGARTISAVKSYQSSEGIQVTGLIDDSLIESLAS